MLHYGRLKLNPIAGGAEPRWCDAASFLHGRLTVLDSHAPRSTRRRCKGGAAVLRGPWPRGNHGAWPHARVHRLPEHIHKLAYRTLPTPLVGE